MLVPSSCEDVHAVMGDKNLMFELGRSCARLIRSTLRAEEGISEAHLGTHGPSVVPQDTARLGTLHKRRLDGKAVSWLHLAVIRIAWHEYPIRMIRVYSR